LKALRRLARRRRGGGEQHDTSPPFVVHGCECIRDGEFALLRVTGGGRARPVALVVDSEHPEAFAPLPDAESGDGSWRAAFALPAALAEPGAPMSLHDGLGYRLEIGAPGPDRAAPPAEPPAEASPATEPELADDAAATADDPRARKLVQAWSEANQLREQLDDRERELAEARQELRALRGDRRPLRERAEAAERDLAAARRELEEGRAELNGVDDEIDAAREELAGALRDAAAERSSHEIECGELREALDELRAELEKMEAAGGRRRLGRRRRGSGAAPDDQEEKAALAALEAQVSDRQRRLDELEHDIREQVTCNDDLRALLESEREQAARARAEADDLRRQLARDSLRGPAEDQVKPTPKPPKPTPAKDAPPWSALDDELLARIEKAKSLTS
jgi:hypothetical protein